MKNKQKGFIGIPLIILIALVIAGGGFYAYTNYSKARYEEMVANPKNFSNLLSEGGMDAEFMQKEIAKRILNESGNEGERIGLARILGESNTPRALATLIKVIQSTKNQELYRGVVEQMSRMGYANSSEQAAQMTIEAKKGWETIAQLDGSNEGLYYIYGAILAKLGEPDGISFLRSEAVRGGSTISELNSSNDVPAKVAMEVSLAVQGQSSVLILADALKRNDPNSTEFVWSGQALSSIGYEEGASALVKWSQTAPDSCAELAGKWLGNFKDSHSVEFMKGFSPLLKFESQKVKDVVIKASENYSSYPSVSLNTEIQNKLV